MSKIKCLTQTHTPPLKRKHVRLQVELYCCDDILVLVEKCTLNAWNSLTDVYFNVRRGNGCGWALNLAFFSIKVKQGMLLDPKLTQRAFWHFLKVINHHISFLVFGQKIKN